MNITLSFRSSAHRSSYTGTAAVLSAIILLGSYSPPATAQRITLSASKSAVQPNSSTGSENDEGKAVADCLSERELMIKVLLAKASEELTSAQNARIACLKANPNSASGGALYSIWCSDAARAGQTVGELGQLQAQQAIPILAANLDFTDPSVDRSKSILKSFPCMDAICMIGANRAMMDTVAEDAANVSPNRLGGVEQYYSISAQTLIQILGQPAAEAYVKFRLAEETDATRTNRLAQWLNIIEKLDDHPVN